MFHAVPALTVSALLEGMERLGYDTRALTKAAGIRREDLKTPNASIPDPGYPRLLFEACEKYGRKSIGAEVGAVVPHGALGVMDYVVSTTQTLGEAIDAMSKLNHLVSGTGSHWEIESHEKNTSRLAFVNEDTFDGQNTSDEFALSLALGRFRNSIAGTLEVWEVQFTSQERRSELAEILKCSVSFGHARSAIVLPSRTLNLPMKREDPRLNGLLWGLIGDLGNPVERKPSLHRDVRGAVQESFAKGRIPELHEIAKSLGLSDRTLQRHLRKEGSEFEVIADEVRKEHALRLIQDQNRTILSISLDLGFSNERSLARAFHRWTGRSPRDYRQNNMAFANNHSNRSMA